MQASAMGTSASGLCSTRALEGELTIIFPGADNEAQWRLSKRRLFISTFSDELYK